MDRQYFLTVPATTSVHSRRLPGGCSFCGNRRIHFPRYLKLHGFNQDGSDPNVFYANAIEVGTSGLRPGFDEKIASHDNGDVATLDLDHIGGALNLQWYFADDMTFTSITGYDTVENFQSADVDGGEISFNPADIGELGKQVFFGVATGDGLLDHNQFTQEFRLAGAGPEPVLPGSASITSTRTTT